MHKLKLKWMHMVLRLLVHICWKLEAYKIDSPISNDAMAILKELESELEKE